jgi:hypothetical protein
MSDWPNPATTNILLDLQILLGLDFDIEEIAAKRIWAELQIIDGRKLQGRYASDNIYGHLFAAYHAIAKEIVGAGTSDEVLERTIPKMVDAWRILSRWPPEMNLAACREAVRPAINEWKGHRLAIVADEELKLEIPLLDLRPAIGVQMVGTVTPSNSQAEEPEQRTDKTNRRTLYEGYLAGFQEKTYILDFCWAAKQRYRELSRWLSENSTIKDGSKPDKAFRAVIASGLAPDRYRQEPRPKLWK